MVQSNKPKHVIIAAQCNEHSAWLAGIPFSKFFTDAHDFVQTQLLVSEYYGFDAPNNTWDVYNIEAEAMGQQIVYYPDRVPDIDRKNLLLSSPDILDKLSPPNPYKSGRMPWVHSINKMYKQFTGKPARVYFCAPFSLAVNIRGYENLIMDIYTNSKFAHRLFEFLCDKVISPYIQAMRSEIGQPNALADGNDAWASPPLISLDIMEEFVVRYAERLRETLDEKVVTRGNWGDSKSSDPEFPECFMYAKLKACPGFLSILDPDLYELGPKRIKVFSQAQNAFVVAGFDAALLRNGPIEAIMQRIKYYIDIMARDGRCIIYLNQIPSDTPSKHIHAAVAACHAYGQFPIAKNLDDIKVDVADRESFSEFLSNKGKEMI